MYDIRFRDAVQQWRSAIRHVSFVIACSILQTVLTLQQMNCATGSTTTTYKVKTEESWGKTGIFKLDHTQRKTRAVRRCKKVKEKMWYSQCTGRSKEQILAQIGQVLRLCKCKKTFSFRGLCSPPGQQLYPWTPLGALSSDLCYRLTLCAHHVPLKLWPSICPCLSGM